MKQREIKFRVWNGAEMVYDVTLGKFGVFYVNPTNNGLDPKDSASITPFTTKYHEDTPVMQFTGLKDKSGKEIYDRDLIRSFFSNGEPCIHEVRYVESEGRFMVFQDEYDCGGISQKWIDDHEKEVIGNIYEPTTISKD
jgi:uncharacterized phage protein (TIGR01671 family)